MQVQQITTIPSVTETRITTGLKQFDSFLGGGFVNGETIFLAGQPGVGKSTLLLQLATILTDIGQRILYVSGEESLEQLKLRADRLNTLRDSIFCSNTVLLEELVKTLHKLQPKFIIIDSLQMLKSTAIKGEQGSAKQMKHCLLALIDHAKKTGQILIVIGHSTKTGLIAGLLTLQHMVDAVFFISKENTLRTIHAHKNRFGAVDEQFSMHMTKNGFSEFSRHITKGFHVQPSSVLPYLQHKYGDEVRISRKQIDEQIASKLVRTLIRASMGFLEKLYFGKTINQEYEIVFKLK